MKTEDQLSETLIPKKQNKTSNSFLLKFYLFFNTDLLQSFNTHPRGYMCTNI